MKRHLKKYCVLEAVKDWQPHLIEPQTVLKGNTLMKELWSVSFLVQLSVTHSLKLTHSLMVYNQIQSQCDEQQNARPHVFFYLI